MQEDDEMTLKKQGNGNRPKSKKSAEKVQFEFPAPEAREVFVAGEFNNWDIKAAPLKKDKNGIWKITLPLSPGRYEYRFLSDGKWVNDPASSGCVPNHFGSLNCVKIVG
jgi:1,4-alpha-glucan branching enzyme